MPSTALRAIRHSLPSNGLSARFQNTSPRHWISWRKSRRSSPIEAAGLPLVGTTALQAFIQHKVREGQRVLVIGASGGVGHIAVQVACHLGAHVTAICSSRNTAFVKDDCGAGAVLSYDDGDVFAKISEDARRMANMTLCSTMRPARLARSGRVVHGEDRGDGAACRQAAAERRQGDRRAQLRRSWRCDE